MKFKLFIAQCLSWCLFSCSHQREYKPVKHPVGYTAQIDVIYKKVDDWEGRIDLYTNPTSKDPTPIVLNIHGGSWSSGEKESQTDFGSFFKNDYAVANVEYRLVDVAAAPAAIEDVRCALIYLYNNSKELNIDTNKIVIKGESAGAQLGLMAGLLRDNNSFDAECTYEGELKVAALISKYGVTDFVTSREWQSAKNWLGDGFGNIEFTKSVSPVYQVSKDSPPVFIAHGDSDELVPYSQSEKLYKALKDGRVYRHYQKHIYR